jgi:polar amino acid transport system substrate-binding protein
VADRGARREQLNGDDARHHPVAAALFEEDGMSDSFNDGKRDFLKGAAVLGVASGVVAAMGAPRQAMAQMLETGIRDDSSLAKVRKAGVMRVGYSQTGPWFYKDAKSGELGGIYKDAVDRLAKEMEVKVEFKETTFQNATVGLRRDDYDFYGSSLTYTMARALVVDYVGPLWAKGSLLLVRKDNASRFKTLADFNNPNVTFSVVAGGSEEPRIPILFPKAKLITTTGQVVLGAEPVRAKKADVWMSGDSDVLLFAKRNSDWAHVFDPSHPIDKRPNTWAVRYGDPEWKNFLDFYATFLTVNGEMERLFNHHMEVLGVK